jgi:DNA-binding FadR family transcriptional regulator
MTITAAAPGPGSSAWADELIQVQAITVGTACEQLTASALQALSDSVERAAGLPSRPGWELKAAAHAETFRLLADAVDHPAMARVLSGADRLMHDVMVTVGPAANGLIISSRQRLLAHLRAREALGAALEMENHLRVLHYMWRLAGTGPASPMITVRSGMARERPMSAPRAIQESLI